MAIAQKAKKKEWKIIIKRSVRQYWVDQLRTELVGKTHNIWDTVENSVIEVGKATTKARMLTGTYILQVHKSKFNQAEIDTICPLCRTEDENLLHILTRCPAYTEERKKYYCPIKETVISRIGANAWQTHFNNIETIGKLIIDCQSLAICSNILPKDTNFLKELERATREYCYAVHVKRIHTMECIRVVFYGLCVLQPLIIILFIFYNYNFRF